MQASRVKNMTSGKKNINKNEIKSSNSVGKEPGYLSEYGDESDDIVDFAGN